MLRKILSAKLWKISIAGWLGILVLALLGFAVFSIFFAVRQVLPLRPEHSFNVRDPAFFGSAHALGDPIPLGGNRIELLHNGDEAFGAMLEAIRSARKSINFEAFLFQSGKVAGEFSDAFCERARSGVRVRILLDGVGSGWKLDNKDVEIMKRAGCHFAYYHPTARWRLDQLNRRTHRRILVVDGKVGFTGGIGFSDEWAGNADAPGHWRDEHARIEGPLVSKLQGAFQQHWVKETGEVIAGPDEFPTLPPSGPLIAQMTASRSFSIAPLPLIQAVAISAAEKRVFITNAYCTPTADQVGLLVDAVKRGVDVRILLPGKHQDQPLATAAGRDAYGRLLEGGVQIFEYQPTMIHSKTMVVDGMFSMFGTSNFDARSAAINDELDVTVYDEAFGRQMEDVFLSDLKHATPYELDDFRKRSIWERTTEFFAGFFRSQL